MKFAFVISLVCALSASSAPTIRYVDAAASGANNGTSWANAWTTATAAETGASRDTLIYVADGSYTSTLTCDTAVSGSLTIEFRKATASDHGSDTGWVSTMGDGVATFSSVLLGSDYWIFSGAYRNESDWIAQNSYGFRMTGGIAASTSLFPGVCASGITLRYIDGGGPYGTSYTGTESDNFIYIAGFDELCGNWLVQSNHFHNIAHAAHLHGNGIDGITVEGCMFTYGWGKESIRGQIAFKNAVIRWCGFINAGGSTGVPGEGCTAEIACWDGSSGQFNNIEVYGSWFWRDRDPNSGGTIVLGDESGAGPLTSGCKVYNNTIAGIDSAALGAMIYIFGGSNEARNNLWYDVVSSPVDPGIGGSGNTTSGNTEVFSNPFIGYASANVRLVSSLGTGTSLGSPYNKDADGNTRGADGTWDVGAFEFGSGSTPPATIPAIIGIGRASVFISSQ